MSRNEFDRLFDRLDQLTVGFGPLFREFQFESTSYPPHNIIKRSDTELVLELAVAGFRKSEITLEEHESLLTVKGVKESQPEEQYQFRGIGKRSFEKKFKMAEYFEIAEATLEDGILTVVFKKNVPEEAQPKLIAIK